MREAFFVWGRVALLSFGGPAGQIATMHRILVDEKRWIGEQRFLHALSFCMLLPGPEAQQLATYVGWLMHRTRGGLLAGGLFILPGLLAIMALSWLYVLGSGLALVDAIFFGLKAAVLAIVLQALMRVAGRSLRTPALLAIAGISFVAIFFLAVPFPVIILAAGALGFAAGRMEWRGFASARPPAPSVAAGVRAVPPSEAIPPPILDDHEESNALPSRPWFAAVALVLGGLWLAPTLAILAFAGSQSVFADIGIFFSQLALVTFGGAYAVLAYVAQAGVEFYGWLTPSEMLDGLALAETTPGPLIMVLQFVGFLAAFRDPGSLPPLLAATAGGLLATWVTFLPSFLFVFLGAPFVERLRGNRPLAAALSAVSAAVVGVILNLTLWFALHSLFAVTAPFMFGPIDVDMPVVASIDLAAVALTLAAGLGLFRFGLGIGLTLALSALAGIALWWIGLV
jgi:chromate transporter